MLQNKNAQATTHIKKSGGELQPIDELLCRLHQALSELPEPQKLLLQRATRTT